MNIVRRDPSPLSTYRAGLGDDPFSRLFDNMVEEFFAPLAPYAGGKLTQDGDGVPTAMRVNVSETDKTFEVEAELPGVKKEDLNVAIDDRRVTIEAEVKRESAQNEAGKVVYAERSTRKYARSFTLPVDIDDAGAQARLEHGVLLLTLPKKTAAQTKKLTVQ